MPLSINSFHSFMIFFSLLSCAFDQFFCFVFNLCFDEIVTGTQGMIEINDVVLIKFQRISFWFFTFVHVWYTSYLPQDWAIFLSALPLLYFTSAFCCLSSNWFLLSEHYGCLSMFGYTQKIACDLFKFDMIFFKSSINHIFIFSAKFFVCFPWGALRRRWDGGVLGTIFLIG